MSLKQYYSLGILIFLISLFYAKDSYTQNIKPNSNDNNFAVSKTFLDILGLDEKDTNFAIEQFAKNKEETFCGIDISQFKIKDKAQGFINMVASVLSSDTLEDDAKEELLSCVYQNNDIANQVMAVYSKNPSEVIDDINTSFVKETNKRNTMNLPNDEQTPSAETLYDSFVKGYSKSLNIPAPIVKAAIMNFSSADSSFCGISLSQFTDPDIVKNFGNFIVSVMTSGFSEKEIHQFLNCLYAGNKKAIKNTKIYFKQAPNQAIKKLRTNITKNLKSAGVENTGVSTLEIPIDFNYTSRYNNTNSIKWSDNSDSSDNSKYSKWADNSNSSDNRSKYSRNSSNWKDGSDNSDNSDNRSKYSKWADNSNSSDNRSKYSRNSSNWKDGSDNSDNSDNRSKYSRSSSNWKDGSDNSDNSDNSDSSRYAKSKYSKNTNSWEDNSDNSDNRSKTSSNSSNWADDSDNSDSSRYAKSSKNSNTWADSSSSADNRSQSSKNANSWKDTSDSSNTWSDSSTTNSSNSWKDGSDSSNTWSDSSNNSSTDGSINSDKADNRTIFNNNYIFQDSTGRAYPTVPQPNGNGTITYYPVIPVTPPQAPPIPAVSPATIAREQAGIKPANSAYDAAQMAAQEKRYQNRIKAQQKRLAEQEKRLRAAEKRK